MVWILLAQDNCMRGLLWKRYWVPCKHGDFLEYPKKMFSFWRAVLHGVPRFVSLLGKCQCRPEIQSRFHRTSIMSRIDHNSLFTCFKGDIDLVFKRSGRNCVKFMAGNRLWRPQLSGVASPIHLLNLLRHYPIIFCTLTGSPHAVPRLVLWSYTVDFIHIVTDRRLVVQVFCCFFVFWRVLW